MALTLAQLATQLDRRLKHLEAQTPQAYYHAGAMTAGRSIEAWTHSYHHAQRLTKQEALAYLSTLSKA